MLTLALGASGPFILRPIKRRLEYKQEYEIFKLRMTLIACVMAFLSLFIYSSRITDAIFAFLLLYYYCSVVLREHILIVNGSRIRSWWVLHHYLSILTSGILLVSFFLKFNFVDMAIVTELYCFSNALFEFLVVSWNITIPPVSLSKTKALCARRLGKSCANGYSCRRRCHSRQGGLGFCILVAIFNHWTMLAIVQFIRYVARISETV